MHTNISYVTGSYLLKQYQDLSHDTNTMKYTSGSHILPQESDDILGQTFHVQSINNRVTITDTHKPLS